MIAMDRRDFLKTAAIAPAILSAQTDAPFPIGINTYCIRALRWHDSQLLDYAASLNLDAIFLQDSLDPRAMDPAHWPEVKDQAARLGLHLETGGSGILPRTEDDFPRVLETIRANVRRAKAMGSPIVRCLWASDRASFPPGPIEKHMETAVKVLRAVRSDVLEAGLKIAIEVHKDFQAWEHKEILDAAGRDFAGTYLDTGNPVFTLEDPMTTVETLGPYALTFHLRDSVVYEHKNGIAVQWVPLGEGIIDFKAILARARQLCPKVHVYIKPITGRPPQVLPIYDQAFWKMYPRARAADLARFLALAKSGHPYENHMVVEDLAGRQTPAPFVEAIKFQQRDHLERSVEYARKALDLGVRWRSQGSPQ
jgi:3-oxoisoapionate decarboxylase